VEADHNPASQAAMYDVTVVGAGPAGSIAAYVAAKAGASVILLDRAEIPRYKTCGGGLIGTSRQLVPVSTQIPIRAEVRSSTFTLNGGWAFTRQVSGIPFLEMVHRDQFDAALTKAAQNAGAELLPRTTVRRVDDMHDRVVLQTSSGSVVSQVVIGADGSASRIANSIGVRYGQTDLGLELELPLPASERSKWDGHMLIDWGPLPGSYGWVFPKGDSVTVGVIAAKGYSGPTRAYLADFVNRLGFQTIQPCVQSGHLTRCRLEDSPVRRGRVMVIGDAAGFLEPWTREGISFALRSGLAAGEAAAKAASRGTATEARSELESYDDAIAATLVPEMRAGLKVLRAFGRHPSLFHAALATPLGWKAFIRICRGETNFARAVHHRTLTTALALISSLPGGAERVRTE
jgi:geranylgeranyl reductase family protein